MIATRAPRPSPRPCSHAPNATEWRSMSANVKYLSMKAYALRLACFAKPSSMSATSEVYWSASMSAGTPGG